MFRVKTYLVATIALMACLPSSSVASTVLLYPTKNDVKENVNLIDELTIVFQNVDRPLGYEAPADVLLRLILLVIDVFTTASGSYLIQSDATTDSAERRQQQVVAIASTNLWMKLPYTIQIEEVFFNASQLTLAPLLLEMPSRMENIHNDLFNNIEVQIKANLSLYKVYNRERHRVEKFDLPKIVEGDVDFRGIMPLSAFRKLITMLRTFPRLQYYIVHAQFASYARGASLMSHVNSTMQMDYYAVAQAVVSLARDPDIGERVQKLYEKALAKTVEKVKNQLKSGESVLDADQILFPQIEDVFTAESDFGPVLSSTKKRLLDRMIN